MTSRFLAWTTRRTELLWSGEDGRRVLGVSWRNLSGLQLEISVHSWRCALGVPGRGLRWKYKSESCPHLEISHLRNQVREKGGGEMAESWSTPTWEVTVMQRASDQRKLGRLVRRWENQRAEAAERHLLVGGRQWWLVCSVASRWDKMGHCVITVYVFVAFSWLRPHG